MDLSTIQGGKYPPILTYAEIESLNGISIADATVAKLDALITPFSLPAQIGTHLTILG